ncbi:fatty acid desaturase family protein [Nitrosomonas ureae]|uniref:Fatty acid desaturase n=1 Tax=Nitrosomonas ureae TaxID=44577 RepID=A0A1H2DSE1_9PROT|nr:fatty acid desaturase [Nitrosomonas ureae]ALQ50828.1 fatty acid desaturase [Nitrosomonas ureae]SDT85767.1 Fatty acid desaturase [Nitrosomonas ureae]
MTEQIIEQERPYIKEFPLREAHHLVRDLMTPNPWIYWVDFLFHVTLGWAAFFTALFSPFLSLWQLGSFVVAVLALYRSAIFVHELAHLKKGTFQNFRLAWNLLSGIPFMIPSFTYDGVHNDHHKPDVYGTHADGEYLPFATRKPGEIVVYVLLSLLIPIFLAMRFVVLTPLAYLIPPLRKVVWERASSLTIDPTYRRAENAVRNDLNWRQQEIAACLFGTTVIALVILEVFPYSLLILWYLIAVTVFILNSLRTLVAHAYRNPGDRRMTLPEQYLDSINIPGNFLITPLWAPVGLRYHATHHLFMSMPYHNLGKAQRRLVNNLTDNSQYIQTLRSGLWPALKQIWRESSEAATHPSQRQSS